MKQAKPWVIVLDVIIGIAAGILFGVIPGVCAAAIALMWSVPNTFSRRGKIILTVVMAVLVVLVPAIYLVAHLTGASA